MKAVWKNHRYFEDVSIDISKMFLFHFYYKYDVNLLEEKFGSIRAYSCRTKVFMEFPENIKTAED